MSISKEQELKIFKETGMSYFRASFNIKDALTQEANAALKEIQDCVKNGIEFDQLVELSKKLRMPITWLERPRTQIAKKTGIAGPFEVWWETMYSDSKIGIGDTFEEAFKEAAEYIMKQLQTK